MAVRCEAFCSEDYFPFGFGRCCTGISKYLLTPAGYNNIVLFVTPQKQRVSSSWPSDTVASQQMHTIHLCAMRAVNRGCVGGLQARIVRDTCSLIGLHRLWAWIWLSLGEARQIVDMCRHLLNGLWHEILSNQVRDSAASPIELTDCAE